jgi:uncharacterized OB-fold protein
MSRPLTRPIPDALTEPFWAAAREGRLLIQRNPVSGKAQWYPRPLCLDDWNIAPEWIEASGKGTLYSFTVIPRSDIEEVPAPYVLGIVELEEGAMMGTVLIDVDPDTVEIGMPLEVVFVPLDEEYSIPRFRPAAG